jgi:hypothetical protein
MANNSRKRLLVLCAVLALVVASVVLIGQAGAGINAQATSNSLTARVREPAVVAGSRVSNLIGAPVGELYVYRFNGDGLVTPPIPVQVDEVTASGTYTTTDDSVLSAQDEIVFLAQDLGDRPTDTAPLTGSPNVIDWYELEVIDPVNPTQKAWAYLVRRTDSPSPSSVDYVEYDLGSPPTTPPSITATYYALHFATDYPGLDYLALNSSDVDIVDRTKLRAVVEVFGSEIDLTEDDLDNPAIALIKDGPVRVLLQQSYSGSPGAIPGQDVNLSTLYKAYASLLQGSADVSYALTSLASINSTRTSLDFASTVSPGTFYNANTPGGVMVDGSPETIAETPISHWAQVSHSTGSLVQVSDPSSVGGTQKNYYKDDDTIDADDTGDQKSYGDTGILIEGDVNDSFTIESTLYVLDADQDNVGATYEEYYSNPLMVVPFAQGERKKLFLPVIFKNS